jgi:D-alanyl-D-alanine carboxypeptidase
VGAPAARDRARPGSGQGWTPGQPPPDPALRALWARLGIEPAALAGRALALHTEAAHCVLVERHREGRELLLVPAAAQAWQRLRAAAGAQGVALELVSAFRSVARQAQIIEGHLAAGRDIGQVLLAVAPPGCSEHHTGRAVDIGTPGQPGLEEDFERTSAFAWLHRLCDAHGFRLCFTRGNAEGFVYEPWHWCWQAPRV